MLQGAAHCAAQPVCHRGVEARTAVFSFLHNPRIHRPVFGMLDGARTSSAQCLSQRGAKIPTLTVTVIVYNAHLVVAKAVDAILIEKKPSVVNQELPDRVTLEVEHIAARPSLIGK